LERIMPGVLEPYNVGRGRRMIVAGGGTGGHLFPGIAVAQAFLARHHRNRVLFINAGRPLEVSVLDRLGWPHRAIPIEGIKGRGLWRQVRAMSKTPRAVWRSRDLINDFEPDVVLGVGGYSAGPVVAAAWMLGVPTALHEQNQLPGLTNRLLRRIVNRIYLSFEDDAHRFDTRKTVMTGNPVRDEILALGALPKPTGDPTAFNVLVLGGSQGARAINQAMAAALPLLKGCTGLNVVHQTGPEDEPWVARAYAEAGVVARVQAFFDDMAGQYQGAALIVCRAGATTVAEITAVGRAALFIPFPFAADDHQTGNARALVDAGAAEMIRQQDLSGELLAQKILGFARNRPQLVEMAGRARSLGRPEAALTIVNDIYALMEGSRGQ
jgi:UDP-N-acetylglucosamine--N-acetylmuramyl-(pentapeptide) pyrophosphoryl-undecaprenol N-acetylglucosamine transferase